MAPTLRDGEGARAGDSAVFFEVGFVADDDEGDALVVFDADDLFAEFVEFVEGGEGGDGEDEEEALAGFHVEFSREGEKKGTVRLSLWVGEGGFERGLG